MPKLSSFSGLSSRGFGEFGTTLTLTTVTFTSSTSWTAPAGVTNLTTVSGRGSNGQSDYWTPSNITRVWALQHVGGLPNPPYASWATAYSEAQAMVSTLNASGTGPRTITIPGPRKYLVTNSSPFVDYWTEEIDPDYTGYINGAAYIVFDPPSTPTSGNMSYASFPNYYAGFFVYADVYVTGAAGTASTGFSQTFPGGAASGGTAPITVFNNISVSPGTSYSIVIPTDRPDPYITIQYLAPT